MTYLPFAKKSLGQHWLEDGSSLNAIIESAKLDQNDFVLEIGPGTGTLTENIIQANVKVLALEFDKKLEVALKKKYLENKNIEVKFGDIREFDFNTLPKDYKIVANIPYYLTANLFRKLIDIPNKPIVSVLLVQKEVARRVCSLPGQLSKLAVLIQNEYIAELGIVVTADKFVPLPKVDSQVLILTKRKKPIISSYELFEKIVSIGFEHKRKKLSSNLATGLKLSKTEIEQILKSVEVGINSRAQDLSLEDWENLVNVNKH